jgi:CRP-like cAMP-binding protein
MVIDSMKHFEFRARSVVFHQNDRASYFYVVAIGILSVQINKRVVKQLRPGDSFGELALLTDCPRSATIECVTDAVLWGLDRSTF